MLPVRLSPQARRDFIDILRFTGERWGKAQLLVYRDKIDDALRAIGDNPRLGLPRDDLPASHLAYLVGSHVIVYRLGAGGVGAVRILHQRMCLSRQV